MAILSLLALLVVIGALAAPNLLGGGGESAGSNNPGQNNARAGGNDGEPNRGAGGDPQGVGGDQSPSPTASAASTASPQASAGSQDAPGQGVFTARAAEETVQEVYTTAASGNYDASYDLLSEDFKASEEVTEAGWANTFADLQSIRFIEGPDAQVSGITATVTGVTIAETTDQTQRNTVTWRMVREGGGWKLDAIPSFQQEIVSA